MARCHQEVSKNIFKVIIVTKEVIYMDKQTIQILFLDAQQGWVTDSYEIEAAQKENVSPAEPDVPEKSS